MKKSFVIIIGLMLASIVAFSQNNDKKLKPKKLSKEDAANMTPEQRLTHETDRKTKQGKRKMSMKQKVKLEKKQARAAQHKRTSKPLRGRPKD